MKQTNKYKGVFAKKGTKQMHLLHPLVVPAWSHPTQRGCFKGVATNLSRMKTLIPELSEMASNVFRKN